MTRILPLAVCFALTLPSLAYAADRVLFSRLGPTKAALYLSQADGSGEHALAPSTSLDYDPSWSPKGGWIAFTSNATARPICIAFAPMAAVWNG